MNQPNIPNKKVFIIPSLKELSKSETKFGKIDEKCGQLGFTNENCMADYNTKLKYKVKRSNYTEQRKFKEKSNVNAHLIDSEIDFKVVEDLTPLMIDKHKQNWEVLFHILNKQTEMLYEENKNLRPKEGKGIIYVAGHQHNFQQKLFKFKKHSEPKKKYGFSNGSVVKVCKENNALQVTMAYVGNDNPTSQTTPNVQVQSQNGGNENKNSTEQQTSTTAYTPFADKKDKYEYIQKGDDVLDKLENGSILEDHELLDSFGIFYQTRKCFA